jgi:signal peptidase I
MPISPRTKGIVTGGILAIVLVVLVIKTFFIDFYRIPQNGMYPGLPAGSGVFAARHAYSSASSVQRGDIVVFIREESGQHYNYIWRVIALPGESVVASDESLAVNGQAVGRQHLREADGKTVYREQNGAVAYDIALEASPRYTPPNVSITVPPDHFFVMGDNRSDARDSRYFGPISFTSIIGKKL